MSTTTTLLIALALGAILVGLLLIRGPRRRGPSRVVRELDTKLDTTALDTAPQAICIHAQDDPLYGTRVRIAMPRDDR